MDTMNLCLKGRCTQESKIMQVDVIIIVDMKFALYYEISVGTDVEILSPLILPVPCVALPPSKFLCVCALLASRWVDILPDMETLWRRWLVGRVWDRSRAAGRKGSRLRGRSSTQGSGSEVRKENLKSLKLGLGGCLEGFFALSLNLIYVNTLLTGSYGTICWQVWSRRNIYYIRRCYT